ncbi:MAG: hypothetical protein Q4C34_08055 [Bacteroidales bacterium]|nr:hypothetical protein [Bacteroidales bacterium]
MKHHIQPLRWVDRSLSSKFGKHAAIITVISAVVFFLILCPMGIVLGKGYSPYGTFLQIFSPNSIDNTLGQLTGALITLIGSIVISGLFISLFISWVDNRKDRYEQGMARYRLPAGEFAVVIGGHPMTAELCRHLLQRHRIVLVQTACEAQSVREAICDSFDSKSDNKRVVIYHGSRTSVPDLADLQLDEAAEVFIIGEDSATDGDSHDALNLDCYYKAAAQMADNKVYRSVMRREDTVAPWRRQCAPRLKCHIMFMNRSTYSAFQYFDIDPDKTAMVDIVPFGFHEMWAQSVLLDNGSPALYRNPIKSDSGRRVHLVVVGMTAQGVALAFEAARMCHFPNFVTRGVRTLITFIDPNAGREMNYLRGQYRALFELARQRYVRPKVNYGAKAGGTCRYTPRFDATNGWKDPLVDTDVYSPYRDAGLGERFIDVDFEFIEGDVANPDIQWYLAESARDDNSELTVALCHESAAASLAAALYMPGAIYDRACGILVNQSDSSALVEAIMHGSEGLDGHRLGKLTAFGMHDRCIYNNRVRDMLAKIINYVYCLPEKFDGKQLSKVDGLAHLIADGTYNAAPAEYFWQQINTGTGKPAMVLKWSNVYHALSIPVKIDSFGIKAGKAMTAEDSRLLSHVEHNRWNIEQLTLGFRPELPGDRARFADTGDPVKAMRKNMIHPDIRAYEQLNETARRKDDAFSLTLSTMVEILKIIYTERKNEQ